MTSAECLGRTVDWTRVSPDSRVETTPTPRLPDASETCDDGDALVHDDVGFDPGRATQQRLYASVDTSDCADISGAVSFTRMS